MSLIVDTHVYFCGHSAWQVSLKLHIYTAFPCPPIAGTGIAQLLRESKGVVFILHKKIVLAPLDVSSRLQEPPFDSYLTFPAIRRAPPIIQQSLNKDVRPHARRIRLLRVILFVEGRHLPSPVKQKNSDGNRWLSISG